MGRRRVVVTGMGCVTPLANDLQGSWKAALAGKSGIGLITKFDAGTFSSRIAGEVRDFHPEEFIEKKEVKRTDLFVQYAIASASMAMEDSGLDLDNEDRSRIGVLIGSGIGGLETIERNHSLLMEKGWKRISPFFIPMAVINMASSAVGIRYGLRGPSSAVVTACATGANAIGDGFKIIQRGDAEVMVVGGSEAVITPLAVGGFCVMRALSTRSEDPTKASRPFDRNRDGFVLGEGCGIVILEDLDHALARGARIYAEVVGYGMSNDAYHITMPDPQGEGAILCMKAALRDSGLDIEEVGYINAHGTSTPLNDKTETMAIKAIFGDKAYEIPVSSTKSVTGHLLGAAGAVEAIFTIMALKTGQAPPTANYEEPDPDCDLDYVTEGTREVSPKAALSNSFGFGGVNATLAFIKWEGS